MEKTNVKMVYQYDGSKFCGFQRQNGMKTVQGEIEKIIFRTFSQKINMISSGRTDKGVHAMEQVSNFVIDSKIPLEAIKRQINKCLRREVKVLSIEKADKKFNARFNAKSRTYLYIMRDEENITPFEANYVTGLRKSVDVERFQEIMNDFVGKYDFSSFMKKDKAYRNPVREIFYVKCYYDEKFGEKQVNVEICGNGFLKTMVRIMIGSALAVYFGNEEKDYIRKRLEKPNVDGKKILAASEGLYLYKVSY